MQNVVFVMTRLIEFVIHFTDISRGFYQDNFLKFPNTGGLGILLLIKLYLMGFTGFFQVPWVYV